MAYKLLIVDDETANLRLLERLFRDDYFCLTAPSGQEAMRLLDQHDVAVIISDQRMPQMTGLELLKETASRRPHMVRILLTGYTDVEALVEAVNCGLVYMYVSKPWNNEDLKFRVSRAVEHYEKNKLQHSLAANNERLTARLTEMRLDVVRAVARLLQLRDPYLHSHASRVSQYARGLGEKMSLSEKGLADMTAASFLHDLGALGSRNEIYWPFATDDNVSVAKTHAPRSFEIVACIADMRDIADIIRYHHENFDGSGGPLGLIGEEIPLASRILRVAKSFDLLTAPKYGQQALIYDDAIERLRRGSGKEYDPVLIQTLADLRIEPSLLIRIGSSELQLLRTI
jgi:response regulator RpfG family c-di-GMP phosphodiesterase